jgi:hypothetical protein
LNKKAQKEGMTTEELKEKFKQEEEERRLEEIIAEKQREEREKLE